MFFSIENHTSAILRCGLFPYSCLHAKDNIAVSLFRKMTVDTGEHFFRVDAWKNSICLKKKTNNIVSSTAILLPNDFAFWQFSTLREHLKECGKTPKCKVIWQKIMQKFKQITIEWSFPQAQVLQFLLHRYICHICPLSVVLIQRKIFPEKNLCDPPSRSHFLTPEYATISLL